MLNDVAGNPIRSWTVAGIRRLDYDDRAVRSNSACAARAWIPTRRRDLDLLVGKTDYGEPPGMPAKLKKRGFGDSICARAPFATSTRRESSRVAARRERQPARSLRLQGQSASQHAAVGHRLQEIPDWSRTRRWMARPSKRVPGSMGSIVPSRSRPPQPRSRAAPGSFQRDPASLQRGESARASGCVAGACGGADRAPGRG